MASKKSVQVTIDPGPIREINKVWDKMKARLKQHGVMPNEIPWFQSSPPRLGAVGILNVKSPSFHHLDYEKSVFGPLQSRPQSVEKYEEAFTEFVEPAGFGLIYERDVEVSELIAGSTYVLEKGKKLASFSAYVKALQPSPRMSCIRRSDDDEVAVYDVKGGFRCNWIVQPDEINLRNGNEGMFSTELAKYEMYAICTGTVVAVKGNYGKVRTSHLSKLRSGNLQGELGDCEVSVAAEHQSHTLSIQQELNAENFVLFVKFNRLTRTDSKENTTERRFEVNVCKAKRESSTEVSASSDGTNSRATSNEGKGSQESETFYGACGDFESSTLFMISWLQTSFTQEATDLCCIFLKCSAEGFDALDRRKDLRVLLEACTFLLINDIGLVRSVLFQDVTLFDYLPVKWKLDEEIIDLRDALLRPIRADSPFSKVGGIPKSTRPYRAFSEPENDSTPYFARPSDLRTRHTSTPYYTYPGPTPYAPYGSPYVSPYGYGPPYGPYGARIGPTRVRTRPPYSAGTARPALRRNPLLRRARTVMSGQHSQVEESKKWGLDSSSGLIEPGPKD